MVSGTISSFNNLLINSSLAFVSNNAPSLSIDITISIPRTSPLDRCKTTLWVLPFFLSFRYNLIVPLIIEFQNQDTNIWGRLHSLWIEVPPNHMSSNHHGSGHTQICKQMERSLIQVWIHSQILFLLPLYHCTNSLGQEWWQHEDVGRGRHSWDLQGWLYSSHWYVW